MRQQININADCGDVKESKILETIKTAGVNPWQFPKRQKERESLGDLTLMLFVITNACSPPNCIPLEGMCGSSFSAQHLGKGPASS